MSDNNAREMAETQKNIYRQKTDMAMAGTDTAKKRRSAIAIMRSLIGLVKPLLHIMLAAILLGTVGYLCAIFLTILAGQVILHGLAGSAAGAGIPGGCYKEYLACRNFCERDHCRYDPDCGAPWYSSLCGAVL